MRHLVFLLALLGVVAQSGADIRKDGKDYALSTTDCPWELRFPRKNWKIGINELKGAQSYMLFSNDSTKLTVSFWIERAAECDSSEACRELVWSTLPKAGTPQGVAKFTRADFAIVRYDFPRLADLPISQLNYSGHLVRDGFWVDMHISAPLWTETEEKAMQSFVDTITIQQVAR